MSIATEITRLQNAKAAIKTAIEGKGVTVPDATLMDGMAALIDAIEAGGGGVTVAFGTHTPTTTKALNLPYQITHGLGYAPDIFFLYLCGGSSTAYKEFCLVGKTKYLIYGSTVETYSSYVAGYRVADVTEGSIETYPPTSSDIWVRSGSSYNKLEAGVTYQWFAIRGLP